MKISELINWGIKTLKENQIEDETIKAKILMQYVLGKNQEYIIVNGEQEIEKVKEREYKKYIEELIKGKPLQYITNHQEFMGIDFYIDENVLIPQPDTEILVEETIKEIEKKLIDKEDNKIVQVLDLCTGSGAIAISIAKYFQDRNENIDVYATDISEKALEIAKKNAELNDVEITFILSNMFQNIDGKFDVIVSNPPYIESEVISTLSKEVQNEPHLALDGGIDGLDFYKIIAGNYENFLNTNGTLLLEIGYNQKTSVTKLLEKTDKNVTCIKDLEGNDRVIKVEN